MNDMIAQLGLLDDEDILLDDAALALAQLDHPELSITPYEDIIVAIADRVVDKGEHLSTDRERAELLAIVIGEEFGFVGDRDTYDAPENADLISVIDRRRGLPVALSILYVAVARRVGWSAHALDVPGHVLVLIGNHVAPVIIDPFRGGIDVRPDELVALLATGPRGNGAAMREVAAMPNRAVLVRLLRNQATRAEEAGDTDRALVLYERITAFAPEYGDLWWERARIELGAGKLAAARTSLTSMLEVTRDAATRLRVTDTLAAIARSV
jgi:regulator of sirC expression with transglutaminase-like and TPR domain